MSSLEMLVQNYEGIILAEVAAWLHDDFKHTEQQINNYAVNAVAPSGRQDTDDLTPNRSITLMGKSLPFTTAKKRKQEDFIDEYLNRCHHSSHIEKELPDNFKDCPYKQTYPVYVSSPLGFEGTLIPANLTISLRNSTIWTIIDQSSIFTHSKRSQVQRELFLLFSKVGADTRRPINEVSLWEWGHTVGALYKSALAGALLGNQPAAHDLRWRLLGVRLDGLSYTLEAQRLPDLLARRELITSGLDRVQQLLEVTYPLGTEVYRDESGSLFVVPDLPDLINYYGKDTPSLRQLILEEFGQTTLDGNEVIPEITVDDQAWWGQDPDWEIKKKSGQPLNNEIPPVGQWLTKAVTAYADPIAVEDSWENQYGEICTVCSLRPQGPGSKAKDRSVCDICEQRRADRSKKWATQQTKDTIWTNEVSDTNGRLALITGQFDLDHWLDGKLVDSLLVIAPNNGTKETTKTPSFSRIRRIWKTTQQFWQETMSQVFTDLTDDRRRLHIWLDRRPTNLGDYHVYDLDLGQTTLDVVWCPITDDGSGGVFITADNLGYIAQQLNADKSIYSDPASSAIFVEERLKERFMDGNDQPVLRNTEASTVKQTNLILGYSITKVQYQDTSYSTAIGILSEPRTFMALVPANKALAIVQAIRTKYECEMGKVRNRLPLHLGIVFAHRRTPFRAILDAGQRLLMQRPLAPNKPWTVRKDTAEQSLPEDKKSLGQNTKQFDITISVDLKQGNRSLNWHVPAVMGDGTTKDIWYPYVFFHSDKDGNSEPKGRSHVFKGLRPTGEDQTEACWLVHAGELKGGDQVYFTPATFDFAWLDTAAKRFEIAYDDQGRRLAQSTRPYLLDEMDDIERIWKLISESNGLTTNQIYALRETIETKREAWSIQPQDSLKDGTFWQLCHDALRNAQWGKRPKPDDMQWLTDQAVKGVLTDTLELHMGVMKDRPSRDPNNPVNNNKPGVNP